ncbi:MAG: hypothetical protein BWY99_02669 [Synergistetes bacterium ADurb.BinA166]|nr:MAG: hypothetical protein BWY99_02669 [Synergistetes bacterium ADurb.BinA166]
MDDLHDWVWTGSGDVSVLQSGWRCSRCGYWVLDTQHCAPGRALPVVWSTGSGPDVRITCGEFAVLSVMEERP